MADKIPEIPASQSELHSYILVLVATIKKIQTKNLEIDKGLNATIEELRVELTKRINDFEAMPGPKGDRGDDGVSIKGDKGEPGKDGYTPIKGKDYFDGKDGKDAESVDITGLVEKTTTMALEAIKPLIPTVEAVELDIPKLGAPIRDSLELLNGDDRLKIEAIKDLREELDELRKLAGKTQVFGGVSGLKEMNMVENEVISGSGNAWTLLYTLVPNSEKIFANGQRLTPGVGNDYIISGQVITTAQSWNAGTLICDYRR